MKRLKTLAVLITSLAWLTTPSLGITRPGLNRESARLDALQINLAIRDHTDVIGLDHFGGNPAGIVLDEAKSRVVPLVGLSRTRWVPSPQEIDSNDLGLLGLVRTENQAVRLELKGNRFELDSFNSLINSDIDTGSAEIAYNRRWGSILGGASVNYFNEDGEGTSGNFNGHSDPLAFSGGIGWTQSLSDNRLDFGINVNREQNAVSASEIESDEFGFQAIFRRQDDLVLGFSGFIDNQDTKAKASGILTFEDDSRTYKVRGFWDVENSPVQLGAEYQMELREISFHNVPIVGTLSSESDTRTSALGAALNFERVLVGVEGQLEDDVKGTNDTVKQLAAGLESPILKNILGRVSFSYTDQKLGVMTSGFIRKTAVGIGIHTSENSVIDAVYSYSDSNLGPSDRFINEGMVMATLFFGTKLSQ